MPETSVTEGFEEMERTEFSSATSRQSRRSLDNIFSWYSHEKKVLIPKVLQMSDILFIQSIRKSNHFRFLVLCNLPPLRFTTILGHLIKRVLKPFEMSRQHLQTKQKKIIDLQQAKVTKTKTMTKTRGRKVSFFPQADSLIVAELKSKNSNQGNEKHFNNKKKFRSKYNCYSCDWPTINRRKP